MTKVFTFLKRSFNYLAGFFPSRLPLGIMEFEAWSASILDAYGFPNNDSFQFTLAVMVLHLDSGMAYKPKRYFGKALIKAGANQVVSQIIQDLKAKQELEKASPPVEVTTPPPVSNEPQVS